jgi:deoxycytidylate deaminase
MTPFIAMQNAVDIVNTSEHNKNKISSCLYQGDDYVVEINHRPTVLASHFTPDIKIGRSSQFIHSEISCIFKAPFKTDGAILCITDPFCPNCAKAICESGIRHVYIDHKGLDKDFAIRRGDDFQSLSLLMMEKAGIAVSVVNRKENKITPLIAPEILTRKGGAQGIEFFDWNNDFTLKDYLRKFRARQPHAAWAIAKINENGQSLGIIVFEELTQGMTPRDYADNRRIRDKYRLPVDPINRILFFLRRKGFGIENDEIACNLAPSSRGLVNACGFGVQSVIIGDKTPDHDDLGHIAAEILSDNKIMNIDYLD